MRKQLIFITNTMVLFFICPSLSFTQDSEAAESSNFSMGADLTSRYIWRGLNLGGSSPHIQPYVEYTFGNSGLAIGAWGSYSIGNTGGSEADLYLSYAPLDFLSFTFTDYFFPADLPFERSDYFNYDPDETSHTLEAMLTVGGSANIPFYATFAINIFGADGVNADGDKYNAKYIEVGYNGSFKEYDYSTFLGIAPDDPDTDNGGAGWYGDSAGIVNLGAGFSKTITIAEKELPVFSTVIFNPEAGNFYIVFGFSF
ncbi:MAG: TorF family putative porin [Bacteroidota bacterium]